MFHSCSTSNCTIFNIVLEKNVFWCSAAQRRGGGIAGRSAGGAGTHAARFPAPRTPHQRAADDVARQGAGPSGGTHSSLHYDESFAKARQTGRGIGVPQHDPRRVHACCVIGNEFLHYSCS